MDEHGVESVASEKIAPASPATDRPARGPRKPRPRRGHRFFLNPYQDAAFTRCPRCDKPTKVRKVYLVVHVEPRQLLLLNKSCRLCEKCDLLIVKQVELESLMAYAVEQRDPSLLGNDYLVLGTLDRADGRQARTGAVSTAQVIDQTKLFREQLRFEPAHYGWVHEDDLEKQPPRRSSR